ncbi:DUF5683 domain-containing protein [Polaribacter sp. P097]|uniref:DUF5683 domain-containing protein n=1 Tax=Polaribacter sp. P097 TaxID=3117398 RepID=UPI002FE1454D
MFPKKSILFFAIVFFSVSLYSQKDSITDVTKIQDLKIKGNINTSQGIYDPLAPSKAAFYSAIFPGLGQIYNKKYWKAPIVWGAMAIPVYYYQINNRDYRRFRTAYRLRQNGLTDEFTIDGVETVSTETLETAQEQLSENRDFSLLSGIVIYILQIVEASVNAHLMQFNTDDNLTFKPTLIQDPISFDAPTVGLTIKYNF